MNTLPGGAQVVFLKPGKEAFRERNPKPHDMTPVVPGYERAAFKDVWSVLARISLTDPDAYRTLGVLVYRSAFHLDHSVEDGRVRYRPPPAVAACIDALEQRLRSLLPDSGVWALLHFLDLLGWNEDVKYHFEGGRPTFTGKYDFKTGRLNTLLTCIRVPYEVARFASHAGQNIASPQRIDFGQIIGVMQQFSTARGTCVPSDGQLVEWFEPYLRA